MTISPLCYMQIGCGVCGIEINPHHVRDFQTFAQRTTTVDSVGGLRPQNIDGLCDDFAPAAIYEQPSDPVLDDAGQPAFDNFGNARYAAPWYNPSLPETSGGAFGFIFRNSGEGRFSIQSPRELAVADATKARAKGCTLTEGRRIATAYLEVVGTNEQSVQYLIDWLTNMLVGESHCCGRQVEIFVHCCGLDGKSGKRLLTDVAEFNIECISPDEFAPSTRCGTVVAITFSAGDLIIENDERLEGVQVDHGVLCMPQCPPTTQRVESEVFGNKTSCAVDLFRQTDGSLRFCFVDCADYDPATHYAVVRNVAADTADAAACCPVEFSLLDLYSTTEGQLLAAQPTLYQSQILDRIADGTNLDCTCQPVIRRVRIANPNYNPNCPNCPTEIRARQCAESAGFTVGDDGFITGIPSGTFTYVGANESTGDDDVDRWLTYLSCVGEIHPADTQGKCQASGTGGALNNNVVVQIAPSGATTYYAETTGGTTFCNPGVCQDYVLNPPGTNVPQGQTPTSLGIRTRCQNSAVSTGPNPIVDSVDVLACNPDSGSACSPYLDIEPTGTGPCVTINLAPGGIPDSIALTFATGDAVDLANDDLSTARFEFGPCGTTTETGVTCEPIIPALPTLTLDTTTSTATPDNFEVGSGWPYATTGAQYTISATELGPNNDDAIVTTEVSEVPIGSVTVCEPACGTSFARRLPITPDPCWPECQDEERHLATVEITGLDPSKVYIPGFTIQATNEDMQYVEAFISPMASAFQSPQDSLAGYVCGETEFPPVQLPKLTAYQTARLRNDVLKVECGGGFIDARANGFAATGLRPFGRPRISNVDRVFLVVLYGCGFDTPPTIDFFVEAVSTS